MIGEEVVLDTVVVNTRRTRTFLGLFKGRVKRGVTDKLKKANAGFKASPAVLRRVPSLDSLIGIPPRLVDPVPDNGDGVLFSQPHLPVARPAHPRARAP